MICRVIFHRDYLADQVPGRGGGRDDAWPPAHGTGNITLSRCPSPQHQATCQLWSAVSLCILQRFAALQGRAALAEETSLFSEATPRTPRGCAPPGAPAAPRQPVTDVAVGRGFAAAALGDQRSKAKDLPPHPPVLTGSRCPD